jgi:hypothetical protein
MSLLFEKPLPGKKKSPDQGDLIQMWETLEIIPLSHEFESHAYLLERSKIPNSNQFFVSFEIKENEIFDWYAYRNLLNDISFFEEFLAHKTVRQKLPFTEYKEIDSVSKSSFERIKTADFCDELYERLYRGGPYPAPQFSEGTARNISKIFGQSLISADPKRTAIINFYPIFCEFFFSAMWDYTYFILNKETRHLHLLMLTATD